MGRPADVSSFHHFRPIRNKYPNSFLVSRAEDGPAEDGVGRPEQKDGDADVKIESAGRQVWPGETQVGQR